MQSSWSWHYSACSIQRRGCVPASESQGASTSDSICGGTHGIRRRRRPGGGNPTLKGIYALRTCRSTLATPSSCRKPIEKPGPTKCCNSPKDYLASTTEAYSVRDLGS